tara:strand:+ start:3332 stop:4039 length:708 start_codon:yes stop_codon:yes gene_type:complete
MEEEQIKSAFTKVKQDMDFLTNEITQIKQEIKEIKQFLDDFSTSTLRHITSTDPATSTQTSTVPYEIQGLSSPNLRSSIGNEGASTDRQTLRQTDRHIENEGISPNILNNPNNPNISPNNSIESDILKATDILDSLDQLKKDIRFKFKRITNQEMAVFSTIYQLEEQNKQPTTYKETALKLGLSESSIRDYVQRMINKGIPIKKQRVNNRQILLSISEELKRIATLPTIIQLRAL